MTPPSSLRVPGARPDGDAPEPDPADASIPTAAADLLRAQRDAVRSLIATVAERAQGEAAIERTRQTREAEADSEFRLKKEALTRRVAQLEKDAAVADELRRREVDEAAASGEARAKNDFAMGSRRIAAEFDALRQTAKSKLTRDKSDAIGGHDSGQKVAAKEHALATKPLQDALAILDSYRERLAVVAADFRKFDLDPEFPHATRESYDKFAEPVDEVFERLSRMGPPLKLLERLIIPRSMKGANEAWVYIITALIGGGVGLAFGADLSVTAILAGVGLALGLAIRMKLVELSKQQLDRLYKPLMQSASDAAGLADHAKARIDGRFQESLRTLDARREKDLEQAKEAHTLTIAQGEADRDERLRQINEVYARKLRENSEERDARAREAVETHARKIADLKAKSEAGAIQLEEGHRTIKAQALAVFESDRRATAARWRAAVSEAAAVLDDVARRAEGFGLSWDADDWADRALPREIPPAIRFGTVALDLGSLPGGLPADPKLMEGLPDFFQLPALRPFPASANLLVETPAEGRAAASTAIQAAMLRLLTGLPPGMVRFTIVDPIGLGRGFGAFMHLADFDEALVNRQVWTDARQIEERLADLEAHMELVTQRYLRNEYASIEEYNAAAGEVAEPYRVLVVVDYPTKFDEKAASRLASIVAGGPPCGVLTLIAVDEGREFPTGCRLADLRPYGSRLVWKDGTLAWDDPELGGFPFIPDAPPVGETATRLIQRIGEAAKAAKRVEVPFEFIAPAPESWWTFDSRAGLDVPLGKAAASKRQHLALGKGTSQHVLIAGRTGSGKSTLMHAMIVNLALAYSPDEIDLYLIDFKKGVEFKVYASHGLPHASVVAIESEREFGVSVLNRLDAELKIRADRFRAAGVQDVQGFRNLPDSPPLPRILLVVDEFQEFFVEEDKLAQEAAGVLDRLVRQGRAFGIHAILGSQSLGGAFTLARSTLGQMAVRIALQCSDVDSHLILSENNPAAKALSRPGEAIYNDANGSPEGNHVFQVVWLGEDRREDYLDQIRALSDRRPPALARAPIVFEGDAQADLATNPLLLERLGEAAWPDSPRSAKAWLGDPVAIKEPTAALFRRQGGNHLLIVGQNEEAAIGVTAAALASLAAQFPPAREPNVREGAEFRLLDGTPEDSEHAETLRRTAEALPHKVRVGGWREASAIVAEVGAELKRRREPVAADGPELFLLIHDLPRFRDLRRREDDFHFGEREDETPADLIDLILREGPGHGVHLIAWCDTVNNLNRCFSLQQLREFGMRVVFQMSTTDSGHLLDSPAAARLGPNRALYSSEEHNQLEKFRPYRPIDAEFLSTLHARLSGRIP
ncbi:FtsK/SpoIIIE domain-containing protein [Planctomyces sp. SH-PL62]|uniref:FtsK/SpoIIIE domain-containing protein n=1 Tax=Planctomyces sp. SH-PL62 TaxID=1636152 RepID=UPI00078CF9AD|nr:FtsK/SpoIIIE domain-containing protein [Planctomyces sp. SH-PL62]AMV39411.1 DNA translocase FtsK [Planctomyces sp. SH-PL62]